MATERPRHPRRSDSDLGDDRVRDDAELDDERVRDDEYARDFGGAEPADPLGQSMPDVTEAHVAEAGGPVRKTSEQRRARPHVDHEHDRPRKGLFGRAMDFLRASYQELRRVQWPDRRQVGQGTAVTLGFVIVAGAYLGLLDAIWNPIIQAIL
ncbi:MAG TPA: preprotein translocase subunit SecE [Solirubrobacter sp.]|nr:preprotein translocase subunit SecE [Solirubrobacter sp.]